MQCEMCGKDSQLLMAVIEGTNMNVCKECAKFGKVIKRVIEKAPETKKKKAQAPAEPEKVIVEEIIEGYAQKIKTAREEIGLKQEDLAKKLNEKESWIHNLECGKSKPSIELAKKIGKVLNLRLVYEYEETRTKEQSEKGGSFTIGDFIKIKKKE